jgi:hypothetical protein
MARGVRPGSRGILPSSKGIRPSPPPTSKSCKTFTSAFEAFDPSAGSGERIIESR